MKKLLLLLTTAFTMTNLTAQAPTERLVADWERAKAYSKAYLDAMPPNEYALKPTEEMRSFAEQFLHLSEAIYTLFAAATDEQAPYTFGDLEKLNDNNKESVTNKVMEAYDYAINSIKKYPKDKLSGRIKLFGKFEMSKEEAMFKCFEHQTHHRGQATVYLRLAGITPPQEKLF